MRIYLRKIKSTAPYFKFDIFIENFEYKYNKWQIVETYYIQDGFHSVLNKHIKLYKNIYFYDKENAGYLVEILIHSLYNGSTYGNFSTFASFSGSKDNISLTLINPLKKEKYVFYNRKLKEQPIKIKTSDKLYITPPWLKNEVDFIKIPKKFVNIKDFINS